MVVVSGGDVVIVSRSALPVIDGPLGLSWLFHFAVTLYLVGLKLPSALHLPFIDSTWCDGTYKYRDISHKVSFGPITPFIHVLPAV